MRGGKAGSLLMLAAAMLTGSAAAEVYKWVDKAGNVHFGDQPPPGEKAVKENIRPPESIKSTPSAAPVKSPSLLERDLEFKKRRSERLEGEKKQAEEAKQKEARKAECERSRARLADVESGMQLFDYGKDGQRYYLDQEQRTKASNEARQRVEKDCK